MEKSPLAKIFVPEPSRTPGGQARNSVGLDIWLWHLSCSKTLDLGQNDDDISCSATALDLLQHPEYLSPILSRADTTYDSDAMVDSSYSHGRHEESIDTNHIGEFLLYQISRKLVLKILPRNPKRDKAYSQSIWLFLRGESEHQSPHQEKHGGSDFIVLLAPHIDNFNGHPFWFPRARAVAIRLCNKELSIHYLLRRGGFPGENCGDTELTSVRDGRMSLRLLDTLGRHLANPGYQKRVYHDTLVPRDRYQETYHGLKQKYAKTLCEIFAKSGYEGKGCREVDKLFEEIGIASFCICVWETMYHRTAADLTRAANTYGLGVGKRQFGGFVDMGCGSGVLTYVLIQEGWKGYGYDAKRRRVWEYYDETVRDNLVEFTLIPSFLDRDGNGGGDVVNFSQDQLGIFAPDTFIICNHGDELTAWTPLLASLNLCPFLVIPCCSFNLMGKRIRANPQLLQQPKRNGAKRSAYQSLIEYVEALCREVGVQPEREWLRIPSTRNLAILGRCYDEVVKGLEMRGFRESQVRKIVHREVSGV